MRTLKPRVRTLDTRRVRAATTKETSRLSGGAWETIRVRILRRDMGLCQLCKATGRVRAARVVDHISPLWEGGSHDDSNLQSLCVPCHDAKSAEEAKRRG